MKITFTQDEINEIITGFLKDKYSGMLSENHKVTEVNNVGKSYKDVELTIEKVEEVKNDV
ncbi:hypothetical protein LCGC14_1413390 [marine sediment metagenome]|uniref:Uncharacterized protein n=1 Tax=marine sediment metagenome TaxID=412755 RepID=A0A0F9MV96_9ZZZZ|nr:hypothetical protein [Candidatus Aminicenantes bacterium]